MTKIFCVAELVCEKALPVTLKSVEAVLPAT